MSINNKLLGDAGEHYIAFQLARRGLSPALLSQNTKGCDILATDDGANVVSIQVKTSAGRSYPNQWCVSKRKPEPSDNFFYIFVNIYEDETKNIECFIVPSKIVVAQASWNASMPLFKISAEQKEQYRDCWKQITNLTKSV